MYKSIIKRDSHEWEKNNVNAKHQLEINNNNFL